MPRERSVLLIAYYYPPKPFSGSVRARNIATSLSRRGFIVHVVTPNPRLFSRTSGFPGVEPTNITVHETSLLLNFLNPDCTFREKGHLGRFLSGLYKRWCNLTSREIEFPWNKNLATWLDRTDCGFDYAIVTCSPYSPAYTVMKWCRKHQVPLIVDYRDLLVGNPHSAGSYLNSRIACQEAEWLANASAITTVSESWRKVLSSRPEVTCPVYTISNGFDADEFLSCNSTSSTSNPFIIYSGIFLPPKRSIDPLFEALRLLPSDFQDCFHYFGPDVDYVQRKSVEFDCQHLVVNHGMKSRDVVKQYLREANASIVISTIERNVSTLGDAGIVPAKIYEAMALGIPILAFAPIDSDVAEMLTKTEAGSILDPGSPAQTAASIRRALAVKARYQPPAQYSWDAIGDRLTSVLDSV